MAFFCPVKTVNDPSNASTTSYLLSNLSLSVELTISDTNEFNLCQDSPRRQLLPWDIICILARKRFVEDFYHFRGNSAAFVETLFPFHLVTIIFIYERCQDAVFSGRKRRIDRTINDLRQLSWGTEDAFFYPSFFCAVCASAFVLLCVRTCVFHEIIEIIVHRMGCYCISHESMRYGYLYYTIICF